jgi:DNA-binding phage protein
MARRSKDWNEGLAKDLKNREFAKEFILASIDEGFSIQHALGKVIRSYGIKEFSELTGIPSPNILRAINPKHNPTQSTLNRLLKPFKLMISVKDSPQRKKAA